MERQIAYSLGDRRKEFLEQMETKGFVYNPYTFEIRSEGLREPIAVLIESPRYVHIVMPKDSARESQVVINKRQRLMELADNFR